jgi:hypothetical protein
MITLYTRIGIGVKDRFGKLRRGCPFQQNWVLGGLLFLADDQMTFWTFQYLTIYISRTFFSYGGPIMNNKSDKPMSKLDREQTERAKNEAIPPRNIKKNPPALKKPHKQNNEDKKLLKEDVFEFDEDQIRYIMEKHKKLFDRLNDA